MLTSIRAISNIGDEPYWNTMRLSSFSDYTLRVLMYLGAQSDRLVTIGEIAGAHGISESHLTKVVHQLGRSETIETVRGKGGGMRLAKAPSEIVLGEVIRQAEGEIVLAECFSENSTCRIQPACRLQAILAESLHAMFLVLDNYTLADLLVQPDGSLQAIVWREGARRIAAGSSQSA